MKKDISSWLLMLPSLILFTFFIWYPLLHGIVLSFAELRGFKIVGFAGLDNYKSIFAQPVFWKAVLNSFQYTFWSLIIGALVPVIVAIVLSEVVHFSPLFRFSMYFPSIIPLIATTLMWAFLMEPGSGGVLNVLLMKIGIEPFNWLQNKNYTIPLIITTMTWKSAGATAIIYIARLKGIGAQLYEAAEMDGASFFQRMRHITIPQLFNLLRLLLILQILEVFKVLIEPLTMTGGGPNNASMSLLLFNWQTAFVNFRIGQAASIGVIVCLILMGITVVYFKMSKENEVNY